MPFAPSPTIALHGQHDLVHTAEDVEAPLHPARRSCACCTCAYAVLLHAAQVWATSAISSRTTSTATVTPSGTRNGGMWRGRPERRGGLDVGTASASGRHCNEKTRWSWSSPRRSQGVMPQAHAVHIAQAATSTTTHLGLVSDNSSATTTSLGLRHQQALPGGPRGCRAAIPHARFPLLQDRTGR